VSKLVPGMITGFVKRTMNTLLWQKCLYDMTIFWQTRQDSNVSNIRVHAYSFGNSCSRRVDECGNHDKDVFADVAVESWSCLWNMLQRCTAVLLTPIKVHSSSDTIMKYMDAFGVDSDEDYCLRHKHNYTSTCVK
jgi:hypothetical protein